MAHPNQFTFDNEGEPFYGVRFIPRDQADEPIAVGGVQMDSDF